MPIVFKNGWNQLNLAQLDSSEMRAFYRNTKERMKLKGPSRMFEMEIANSAFNMKSMDGDRMKELQKQLSTKKRNELPSKMKLEHRVIDAALSRDKVTGPMAKKFGDNTHPAMQNKNSKQIDNMMEEMQNDHLRMADAAMLKEYSELEIRAAIQEAKLKFAQDARISRLLSRAVAPDGDPIVVTQGVHQSDDPHFDVLMPGETQQYHVEVTLKPNFGIKSFSYMNGSRKSDGVTQVRRDWADEIPSDFARPAGRSPAEHMRQAAIRARQLADQD